MNEKEKKAKQSIQAALAAFESVSLGEASLHLFDALGERKLPSSSRNLRADLRRPSPHPRLPRIPEVIGGRPHHRR